MADHSIIFKIGSVFSGEGLKKAKKTITEVNSAVQQSNKAVAGLSGLMDSMDASAAKSFAAVSNLAQAVLSFNVATIATQVVMFAVNRHFGEMKERAEAAKKAADELKASVNAAFSAALAQNMSGVKNEVQRISAEFESITKQANAFTAALEGVRRSTATGGILKIETEKLNAMLAAHSDAERANIEAEYNLKIATEKLANVEAEGAANVDAAHQAIVDSENRVANIDKQLAVIAENRAQLEEALAIERESGGMKSAEIRKQLNDLGEQEKTLQLKRMETEQQTDVLREKEKQAIQDAANATEQATQGILTAHLAQQKLTEAIHAKCVAEEQAKEKAEMDAAAKEADRMALEEAKSVQTDVNAAARELASAQAAYAAILRNAPQIAADWAANIAGGNAGGAANLTAEQMGKITGTMAGEALKQAIKDGRVQNMKDARDFERQAARDARDAANKAAFEARRDEQRYNQLKNKNDKLLSDKDKKWLENFEDMKKAREGRLKDANDARKRVQDAERKQQQAFDDIRRIRERLCGPNGGNK